MRSGDTDTSFNDRSPTGGAGAGTAAAAAAAAIGGGKGGGGMPFERACPQPGLVALPEESPSALLHAAISISFPLTPPGSGSNEVVELVSVSRIPNSVGWTAQDPDLWANITILVAAALYCLYNCQVWLLNDYGTNHLYTYGDYFYFFNAVFYLLASLRDNDIFMCVPELESLYFVSPDRHRLVKHDCLTEPPGWKSACRSGRRK